MPDVEHAGIRSPVVILPLVLILVLLSIAGAAGADAALFPEADALVAEGRIDEARAALLAAAEAGAGTEREWKALFALNELERDGAKYLERLIELQDLWGAPEVSLALGSYRFAVGAYESAAEDFRRAEGRLEGDARRDAQVWRGASLAAAGRDDEGLELLLDAVRRSEGETAARARFLAAQLCWKRGDRNGCARLLGPALTGEGDFLRPSLLLYARVLEALGETDRARGRYAELIDRFPESAEAEEARHAITGDLEVDGAPQAGFWIQIGSFEGEENARRFAAARRDAGAGAVEVHRDRRGNAVLFPVRIGPFASADEADRAKTDLAAQGLPGHVVELGAEE